MLVLNRTIVDGNGRNERQEGRDDQAEVHDPEKSFSSREYSFGIWNDGASIAGLFKPEKDFSMSSMDEGVLPGMRKIRSGDAYPGTSKGILNPVANKYY